MVNKFGQFTGSRLPRVGKENIGVDYALEFTDGTLTVTDGDRFKATFEVPADKTFVPWVELFLRSDVQVSGSVVRDIFHTTVEEGSPASDKVISAFTWKSSSESVKAESNSIVSTSKSVVTILDSENSLSPNTEWKLTVVEQEGMWVCFGIIQGEFLA